VTESNSITITPATPADARGLVAVQKAGWLATYPNQAAGITAQDLLLKDFDSPQRIRAIEHRHAHQTTKRTWVAKLSTGQVVGFAGASSDEPKEILAMYVDPDFQGQGIGHQLMQTALDWLGPSSEIELHVVAYNDKAIKFYQGFGFIATGATESLAGALPNGKILPEIKMVKTPAHAH